MSHNTTPFWQRRYGDLTRTQRFWLSAGSFAASLPITAGLLALALLTPWRALVILGAGLAVALPGWLIGLSHPRLAWFGLSGMIVAAAGLYSSAIVRLFT